MNFMNPLLWLGALGIALPIIAHLINKHQYKETKWAAMQFLNTAVRVRSRQIKLRDVFLLILRCVALLLIVAAITKPVMNKAENLLAGLGESRSGVIIAIDSSYSMLHDAGDNTRFERAIQKAEAIVADLQAGDPVSLVMLGAEHQVVARNMAFDRERFSAILNAQSATPESLDLDSVPRQLQELIGEMDAPQKEVYFITDAQATDWAEGRERIQDAFVALEDNASTFIVPIEGERENLAVTDLELISGVLRKGTVARYRATVRNYGMIPATNVTVKGVVNNVTVDTKVIPAIAAGASQTISIFVPFHNAGPARISAELDADALAIDNSRRAVAVIRDQVSVLCVEEAPNAIGEFDGFVAAALRPDVDELEQNFTVTSIPWINLPAQDLASFDVIILADVPAITPELAKQLDAYVRAGNGLIWFPGDQAKSAVWNERSALGGTPLLPAVIEQLSETNEVEGAGRPLDHSLSDHSVCNPLRSLSEDLLSEARFTQVLQVKPSATGTTVLSLAGDASPLLIEHPLGRGQVFMFTTSAEPSWNNMALTPIFPMLLQQMVTYLTAREFEKSREVGHSLVLSYVKQPDASDAVFDTPSGESLTVPVRERNQQYVALLPHAREAGFYEAKVGVQARGMPIAVNLDTRESQLEPLPLTDLRDGFKESKIAVVSTDAELADAIAGARTRVSFWRFFLIAGLLFLVIESLVADRMFKGSKTTPPVQPGNARKTPTIAAARNAADSKGDDWQGPGMPQEGTV